ncbi:MAG: hypothetical protein Kow0042_02710 [Calditrichia bacterium]
MTKNYYGILGVDPNATPEQIKAAYRDQVKKLHPDHYGNDREPFLQIQEAYSILSDPQRRALYDQKLKDQLSSCRKEPQSARGIGGYSTEPEPLIPSGKFRNKPAEPISKWSPFEQDSFEELVNRFRQHFLGWGMSPASESDTLTIDVSLSPREARSGGSLTLNIPHRISCPSCLGSGGIGFFHCIRCGGAGEMIAEIPLRISYPARIPHNSVMRIPLKEWGIRHADLNIRFKIDSDWE